VAPEAADILACAKAACAAGDCAVIVVGETTPRETIEALQGLNLSVQLKDAEVRKVHYVKADGLMLTSVEALPDARTSLKNESLGVFANVSRHTAMEAAEAGADFVAFAQAHQYAGEPIIGWWHEVTDVPVVAYDPVEPKDVAALLKQKPDFIRPSDAMWQSADDTARVISELMKAMA
jgi:thiamine-phosphate pyrophosphorylase